MSIKTPRLIRDRCGVYYFRLIVPLSWRASVGKTEIRRSLRTKEASVARQAALALSAQLEAVMGSRKTEEPSRSEAELLAWMHQNDAYKTIVRIYKDGGARIEADTLEEAREARAIVEAYRKDQPEAIRNTLDALPVSKCGTTLAQAKEDFLGERSATLSEKGTLPKLKGVMKAFIAFAGNIDVAMVQPSLVKDYKKKLLAEKKAPTTINDHLVVLTGFFDY